MMGLEPTTLLLGKQCGGSVPRLGREPSFHRGQRRGLRDLGTTLDGLLGREVGAQTIEGADALDAALAAGFASGKAVVNRFDGRGPIDVFYATFATKTAGMPFMATVIAPVPD
jgi:hypothetical protein